MPLWKPFDAISFSARLLAELDPFRSPGRAEPLPYSELDWEAWLRRFYGYVCQFPFAERHRRLWAWIESLRLGVYARPIVEIWPRGGAKSSTGELGIVRIGAKLARRFVLIVSETQEQADKHTGSVAALFEAVGVERAVNKYGTPKSWRRDQLRTANGFNVAGLGLDVAVRGIKLDQYRPDLIVFDDIDNLEDSEAAIEKKLRAIQQTIIPAGSIDCAVCVLQNLIHEDSIVSRLSDGRAEFLLDRMVSPVEVAIEGLEVELQPQTDGSNAWVITAGKATWAGQSIEICQQLINKIGLPSFMRESQQQVQGAGGVFFDVDKIRKVGPDELPAIFRALCVGVDRAATEGGGDYTVLVLMGQARSGVVYVLDVRRGQWGSARVRRNITEFCREVRRRYGHFTLRLPQDPSQAGKEQAERSREDFAEFSPVIRLVSGDKAVRARGFADRMGEGNVAIVEAPWNEAYRYELRRFKEGEKNQVDDQVDASSDAYNELAGDVELEIHVLS